MGEVLGPLAVQSAPKPQDGRASVSLGFDLHNPVACSEVAWSVNLPAVRVAASRDPPVTGNGPNWRHPSLALNWPEAARIPTLTSAPERTARGESVSARLV